MGGIRVSAKAVIIKDGKLLTTLNVDSGGIFYLLPGGGQEPGEPLHVALKRECREEIGVEVEVGELFYVRDYIGRNHEFRDFDGGIHQLELMFSCTIPAGQEPSKGINPDAHQVAVEWLDIAELDGKRLYPQALKAILQSPVPKGVIYIGDVN
ncbi:MAG: NUDIX domain-containing protein [Firmicutes bacterium]|nr:NUDIX domain-containing protein [Bacillota bacterium]